MFPVVIAADGESSMSTASNGPLAMLRAPVSSEVFAAEVWS
jgi:hypothetical protein